MNLNQAMKLNAANENEATLVTKLKLRFCACTVKVSPNIHTEHM